MHLDCFECGAAVEADALADLVDRFLAHARSSHEWRQGLILNDRLRFG